MRLVLPEGLVFTRNAGKLHSKGVELELGIKPLKNFELHYNARLTDAQYQDLVIPEVSTIENKRQLFTPRNTSMLSARYEYPIRNQLKVSV